LRCQLDYSATRERNSPESEHWRGSQKTHPRVIAWAGARMRALVGPGMPRQSPQKGAGALKTGEGRPGYRQSRKNGPKGRKSGSKGPQGMPRTACTPPPGGGTPPKQGGKIDQLVSQ
jgi:hypothetical protein